MQDAKREILQKVASGAISAAEAAAELEALEPVVEPAVPRAAPAPSGTIGVRIRSALGSVTVLGDESVAEAVADGPHTARLHNGTLEIEADENAQFEGFRFNRMLGFGNRALTVRMNPRLPLDADIQAGSFRVQGIRAPIRAEVQMGSTRIEGFTEPIDLLVQAGSVHAAGRLTAGDSHIRCEAGKVSLALDPASSVRITARTQLGSIRLPGKPTYTGVGDGNSSTQVGDGAGTLDVSSEMGSVTVEVAG